MSRKHSLLSPSGASRWLACPPSARAEEPYPDTSSSAADEGTLCHEISELILKNHFGLMPKVEYNYNLKKAKANTYYSVELFNYALEYATFVINKYNEIPDSLITIEEQLDLSFCIPEGSGHVDANIIGGNVLKVIDLKYGKGVRVEAFENKQGMLYAAASLKKYMLLYDIHTIEIHIYQPRLNNISCYTISKVDLLSWLENVVKPTAQMAFKGEGEFIPGDHCKFCKAKVRCKALADFNLGLAKYKFAEANKLTDDQISEILEKAPMFKEWLTTIQAYALAEAVNNNKKWPGFKLIQGRSNRALIEEPKIIEAFKKAKIKPALYLTSPKLLGIGALEKNIGAANVSKLIGEWIIKPAGAPTLVPSWNPQPALNSNEAAAEVFAEVAEKTP